MSKFDNVWWSMFKASSRLTLRGRRQLGDAVPLLARYVLYTLHKVMPAVCALQAPDRVLQSIVASGGSVALTFDLWTSIVKHHMLGITYHWIDKEWRLHAHVLDLIDIGGAPATGGEAERQRWWH